MVRCRVQLSKIYPSATLKARTCAHVSHQQVMETHAAAFSQNAKERVEERIHGGACGIVIVGGGVCGLATALALHRDR